MKDPTQLIKNYLNKFKIVKLLIVVNATVFSLFFQIVFRFHTHFERFKRVVDETFLSFVERLRASRCNRVPEK